MHQLRGRVAALRRTDERGLLAVLGLLFWGTLAGLIFSPVGMVVPLIGMVLLTRVTGSSAFRRQARLALLLAVVSVLLTVGWHLAAPLSPFAAALAALAAMTGGAATAGLAVALHEWFDDRYFADTAASWRASAILVAGSTLVAGPALWWLERTGPEQLLAALTAINPGLLAAGVVAPLLPAGHVLLSLWRSRCDLTANLATLEAERVDGGGVPA